MGKNKGNKNLIVQWLGSYENDSFWEEAQSLAQSKQWQKLGSCVAKAWKGAGGDPASANFLGNSQHCREIWSSVQVRSPGTSDSVQAAPRDRSRSPRRTEQTSDDFSKDSLQVLRELLPDAPEFEIRKAFPQKGTVQLFDLSVAVSFTCGIRGTVVKSNKVAVNFSNRTILSNGGYGQLVAGR
eukprot:gnl/MRDRNA2_/MRDRNA2_53176_c0_seq1.p1 gnl/MRDRNA2_/MRDRNA2_53176_c0~~gnl/MRDRNA2_/MRDRNA2_53176_c0_seq1.p1  ORF type:complete len:183 (+),score=34.65 gnl/MRDRNA2_/MRDRNA2_53176_c0_seq1:104-652(+)